MPTQTNSAAQYDSNNGWNSYWNSSQSSALDAEGFEELQFKQQWHSYLDKQLTKNNHSKVLDVACGNGVLSSIANKCIKQKKMSESNLYCLDYSESAIEVIKHRFPFAHSIIDDASKMPFKNNQFEIVVSHFGIEYADITAFEEVVRILSPDGKARLVCHCHDGAIYKQSKRHLNIVNQFIKSDILNFAKKAFVERFAMNSSLARREQYSKKDQVLASVFDDVEQLLHGYRNEPITKILMSILNDIDYMYRDIQAYNPQDVFEWFDNTIPEIYAYPRRMQSMLDASLKADSIDEISKRVTSLGACCETKLISSEIDGEKIAYRIELSK